MREIITAFSFKAVITSLGGALLTLAIWLLQTNYSNHLEHLRRQSDHGAEFQARLLAMTGNVVDELEAATDRVRNGDPAGAALRNNHELAQAFQQWDTNALLLRMQGAQIYGPQIAPLIYDPDGNEYGIDRCSVLVEPGQDGSDENCGPRRQAEVNSLNALLDTIDRHNDPAGSQARRPRSFGFNAYAARAILDRYLECMEEIHEKRRADELCQNLGGLKTILDDRVELTAVARIDLANAIMAASRVTD
jgi:hypothetical protein